MKKSVLRMPGLLLVTAILAGSSCIAVAADPAIPDPCKLITVAEMEQIVGPLEGAPFSPDPADGQISCGYTPKAGTGYVEILLHEGDLARLRQSKDNKDAVSLPEFGKDAFLILNSYEYTDLWAKKGNLIIQVSVPMGPQAVATVKAVAAKALERL